MSVYYLTNDAKLGLYPTPASGVSVKVYYTARPSTMSTDTGTPDIEAQYHHALVYYAAWRVSELKGRFDEAGYFRRQWEDYRRRAMDYGQKRYGEQSFQVEYNDF